VWSMMGGLKSRSRGRGLKWTARLSIWRCRKTGGTRSEAFVII
jgi:hypothetical protein